MKADRIRCKYLANWYSIQTIIPPVIQRMPPFPLKNFWGFQTLKQYHLKKKKKELNQVFKPSPVCKVKHVYTHGNRIILPNYSLSG